ncbi:hypothetical protein PS2_010124 [Malus domestica]
MPNPFTDLAPVTRSHITTTNVPVKMDVPNRGRPYGSNDSHPQKRKPTAQAPKEPTVNPTVVYSLYPTHEEIINYGSVLEETNPPPENHEISIDYVSLDDVWCRNEMIVNDALHMQ